MRSTGWPPEGEILAESPRRFFAPVAGYDILLTFDGAEAEGSSALVRTDEAAREHLRRNFVRHRSCNREALRFVSTVSVVDGLEVGLIPRAQSKGRGFVRVGE